jgi:hypothetical protein
MAENGNQSLGALEQHLKSMFDRYANNRAALLEPKWHRYRASFARDPTLDAKTWTASERDSRKSKTVFDLTKNKCLAAVTIIYDMLTQGGRLALMFMPEDVQQAKLLTQKQQSEGSGVAVEGLDPTVSDALEAQTNVVDRQLENCDGRLQLLKCLLSGAEYGMFWSKRFTTTLNTSGFKRIAPDLYQHVKSAEPAPGVEFKSVWSMFWDMEAASPEQREGVIERDFVSAYEVRQLKGQQFYIDTQLDLVLGRMAGPQRAAAGAQGGPNSNMPPALAEVAERTRTAEIREFWCRVPLSATLDFEGGLTDQVLETCGIEPPGAAQPDEAEATAEAPAPKPNEKTDAPGNEVFIHAITIDNLVVRYVHVEREDWPYFDDVWELNLDGNGGIGVAENVEQEQIVLNGAVRALEEATKLLGQLILAGKRESLQTDFVQLKTGLFLDLDADCRSIAEAIQQLKLDDTTGPLYKIIELFMQLGDLSSMIPRIEQGQQTFETQTLGELHERLDKAGKYLGMVIQRYDRMVEQWGLCFYRVNMLNPALASAMGSFKVKALGFTSFMNKTVRLKGLFDIMALAKSDPDLKLMTRFSEIYKEIIKGYDIDPQQILKTAQEMDAEAQQLQAQLDQMQAQGAAGGGGGGAGKSQEETMAKIQRLQAESRRADAQTAAISEGMVLKRAEVVTKLEKERAAPPTAATPPEPAAAPPTLERNTP